MKKIEPIALKLQKPLKHAIVEACIKVRVRQLAQLLTELNELREGENL